MSDGCRRHAVAGVPEWSKGAHSRCAAKCFVGSNPTSGTYQTLALFRIASTSGANVSP